MPQIQNLKSKTQNYRSVVQLLRLEAAAIEAAAQRLKPAEVERAIEILTCCGGKVILLGVGKSGVIAQKIAQTMTSTGTVAVFLHPSDALHGSLGIIVKGDIVIALSNSGETDEILTLLPALKLRQIEIIAVVGNIDSTLARNAGVVLDASVDAEACPLNLAPTTSTTVALAIGDALAITLMQLKNLSAEDFASNHPAGRLGKRLTLRVADLMQDSPNITPDAKCLAVVAALSRFGFGAVNVVDESGHLIGIVTDGDLRRTIEKQPENFQNLIAESMMTRNPISVSPSTLAYGALQTMENRPRQISVLPVTDENNLSVGIIRLHDIVRSGL